MKHSPSYGPAPFVTALIFIALAFWVAFHAPDGEPLPTCSTTDSCEYFKEIGR